MHNQRIQRHAFGGPDSHRSVHNIMNQYLRSTEIIDWEHPRLMQCAKDVATGHSNVVSVSKACYEWVRDRITHSGDSKADVTTCCASQVLKEGTGWCFAKSHLLAALLRANEVPAGICYQRLCLDDGNGFTLHGFNAVYLPDFGWYRIDARGNKPGVDAQFCPPKEQLAWIPEMDGEMNLPEIRPDPVPIVVQCLKDNQGWQEVEANLPDIEISK
jgi:transglutaminase-like putative cysteine protease